LCRYIAPDDGLIGKNQYNNDWNRPGIEKCVHAFIGKDKNGNVRVYQTLPWDMRCWGCGSGNKGSYNNSHIQFEMCEDGLTDKAYFTAVWKAAVELCAYLCRTYNISVDSIVGHYEAHTAGYASNHGDPQVWFKAQGTSMVGFRGAVQDALHNTAVSEPAKPVQPAKEVPVTTLLKKSSKGEAVKKLQTDLNKLISAKLVIDGDFGTKTETAVKDFQGKHGLVVDGIAGSKTLAKIVELLKTSAPAALVVEKYRVTANSGLNVRKGPGTTYTKKEPALALHTVVNVSKINGDWAYLPDRDGWACIKSGTNIYLKKV
jgi:N-acetylmuramoyl-L-alanine amidase CwlA